MYFQNRNDAGRQLAEALVSYKGQPNTLVLALPRGGVPVAFEIALALHLPLDLMLVRKLGIPGHEEVAMGAIANGNVQVLDEDLVRSLHISSAAIERVIKAEHAELFRRNQAYRGGSAAPVLSGQTAILVDDGMATGSNMQAALLAARQQQAGRVVVAAPVASDSACALLSKMADEMICLDIPKPFYSVGGAYDDFSQTSDAEVKALLKRAKGWAAA
ncbi:phosphoribosyltransferase [Candidatus Methylospira mobilis]|uniref:Phosphoribosyltransferase n=1 Tax=Candidatus Methylospira mobilis TaxID=1808979 RepID=A0A5Q0BR13_9GAMM|nr:phosphoribosyltransferase [Candidatus Methylospira mobilis]QFY44126.1 phosphoribosyltransferase [Candidatus Methylospira mobilis]WNV06463.1 phosphoribosyltransferase [Candidatus Methylospira mobilis]